MAFSKIKNYWHRETTLDSPPQRRGPPRLCVLKRGCRKHNTNGSGITLNIQMGKLIVYAWIHHCDYLAPLASLLSSLKAMQSAFCFHLHPLKSLDHTMRLYDWSSGHKFIPIIVISLCFNNLWFLCKVQTMLRFLWHTPSMRSVSGMTKGDEDFTTWQLVQISKISVTFTPTLSLTACYYP